MNHRLYREKYRPKSFGDLILLPRIRNIFENGIKQDYIFLGSPGCGKTTLSKIIANLHSSITIKETSVDVLRGKINEFCSYVDIGIDKKSVDLRIEESGFDIDKNEFNPDDIKVVFLDEFDDISKTFQEGLKTFMEDNPNIRFVATSNNISNVLPALKSRFRVINFNAQNTEEENLLIKDFSKRIKHTVLSNENYEMSNEDIVKIVSKNFPDFRSAIQDMQEIIESGVTDITSSNLNIKLRLELFNHIINKTRPDDMYHFIMDNFGADHIEDLIKVLGRPFFNWVVENKSDWIPELTKVSKLVTHYGNMLSSSADPFILGMALVGEIQELK